MSSNSNRCKFHIFDWNTRWRCDGSHGHNGPCRLIPEAVSEGAGGPASGGGRAPSGANAVVERRLTLAESDLLDRAAARLIQTATGKYLKLDWIVRALGKAEALRVRLRTMTAEELLVCGDMLWLIAPKHALQLCGILQSRARLQGVKRRPFPTDPGAPDLPLQGMLPEVQP